MSGPSMARASGAFLMVDAEWEGAAPVICGWFWFRDGKPLLQVTENLLQVAVTGRPPAAAHARQRPHHDHDGNKSLAL